MLTAFTTLQVFRKELTTLRGPVLPIAMSLIQGLKLKVLVRKRKKKAFKYMNCNELKKTRLIGYQTLKLKS